MALLGAFAFAAIALNNGESVNSAWLITAALCVYFIAYRFYGRFIANRVLQLDDARPTPAVRHEDGLDYVPTSKWVLFTIAATICSRASRCCCARRSWSR